MPQERTFSPDPHTPPRSTALTALLSRPKARYLLLSLAVLVLDQWTKWLVELHLKDHPSFEIIPNLLNFTYVRNTGVAFGLFAANDRISGTLILTALGLFALGFVVYYYWRLATHERTLLLALALVIGGAVGNLLDRIMNGGVTDFIDFSYGTYHWHTFNIADSAITVGIFLMIAGSFRHQEEEKGTERVVDSASP